MCRIRRIGLRGIFQLTSSQGGWRKEHFITFNPVDFQLTSSQGGWRYFFSLLLWKQLFNSHPHKEDDLSICLHAAFGTFSTHILTRRMTTDSVGDCMFKLFQFTSSQGGWRTVSLLLARLSIFSTHILTRRMTVVWWWMYSFLFFSTHILTRRMTSNSTLSYIGTWIFNSHPHKEDDDGQHVTSNLDQIFSTHILTRRMTMPLREAMARSVFQLTSSQGGWRPACAICTAEYAIFNSHPHKEDDFFPFSTH